MAVELCLSSFCLQKDIKKKVSRLRLCTRVFVSGRHLRSDMYGICESTTCSLRGGKELFLGHRERRRACTARQRSPLAHSPRNDASAHRTHPMHGFSPRPSTSSTTPTPPPLPVHRPRPCPPHGGGRAVALSRRLPAGAPPPTSRTPSANG